MNYRDVILPAIAVLFISMIFAFYLEKAPEKEATVRMDDVQDFWMSDIQVKIMETHIQYGVPISVGVIAGYFGDDPGVVKIVKKLLEEKLGEVLNHSWGPEGMKGVPYERQEEIIRIANQRISKVLGVEPSIFIPPKWSYDEATLRVCQKLGMKCITWFEYSVLIPEWDFEAQDWKELDADRAMERIEQTYKLHGKVDVYVHFQGIDDMEGYEKLVKWLSENYKVIKLSEFVQKYSR